MNVWGYRERRGRRFPGRLFGYFLETRYGAAEGVLGAVAVMLVLWLLWPEGNGPRLEQRAAWQEKVETAERRRAALEEERDSGRAFKSLLTRPETETAEANGRSFGTQPAATERRRIATPSELADRLDRFGRRPGALASNQSIQPAPRRPAGSGQPPSQAETAQIDEDGAAPPSEGSVQAALAEVIEGLKTPSGSSTEEPLLDAAVLSSESLDFEPLPEVDLSDLDTLVPPKDLETAALVPPAKPDGAAIAPTLDGLKPDAIEPFVVAPDPSAPSGDVRARPRDDAPSWLKNAVTASLDRDRPIIAIVIDDLGLNRRNTAALNDLPAPLTLAFLPYAGRLEAQTDAAQAAGHELMLHLPMEPVGSDWPGPDALTTRIDQNEFTARLRKNLDRFEGFVGINNHMGSRLTADSSRMEVVMRELRERDVLFLDSKTSARSVAGDVAGRAGVPNTTRDVFLDHVIDRGSIKRQLALAERIARRTGSAVAIGHPHGATIEALREWLPNLEQRGFALAPISAVVARRACSSGVLIAAETCGQYLQASRPAARAELAANGG